MLGEALSVELHGSGVSATVLSPGITATEFLGTGRASAGLSGTDLHGHATKVARAGFEGMMRGRALVVPGIRNKLLEWIKRLAPRFAIKWASWLLMRRW